MKPERRVWNTWLGWTAAIACCCCMMPGCRKGSQTATSGPGPAAKVEDPATRELRAIGDGAVTAIMARDVNTLLEYDHNPEDEASLKNKNGDLYCYLFDSSCMQGANQRAIYELFSTSPKLGIDASVANVQGKNYGLLMFYDKSQVSSQELYSPDFLCTAKALKASASWHFILADGKWSTSTLFDYKTERPCKTAS